MWSVCFVLLDTFFVCLLTCCLGEWGGRECETLNLPESVQAHPPNCWSSGLRGMSHGNVSTQSRVPLIEASLGALVGSVKNSSNTFNCDLSKSAGRILYHSELNDEKGVPGIIEVFDNYSCKYLLSVPRVDLFVSCINDDMMIMLRFQVG